MIGPVRLSLSLFSTTTSGFERSNARKKGFKKWQVDNGILVRKIEIYKYLKLAAFKPFHPEFDCLSFITLFNKWIDKIAEVPNRDIFPFVAL